MQRALAALLLLTAIAIAAAADEPERYRIEPDGTLAPADAPPKRWRIVSLSAEYDRDTGLFRARTMQTIDWPEPLEQTADEAIEAHEVEIAADRVDGSPYSRRFFIARALDAKGNALFRTIEVVDLLPGCQGLPGSAAEEEARAAARAKLGPPPRAVLIHFNIKVPLAGTESIEVRGWRPGQVVSWTLDELRKDPLVEKQEVFFDD
ncbi:MAG TPA: hypothetical protein VNA69_16715 [Thermoanaerobaculia bacterium]|nr:hypothetical protein [Thermoanaerobaculia bacterium]